MTDPEFRPPEVAEPPRRRAPHRLLLGVATALVVATGVGVAAAGTSPPSQVQPSPGTSAEQTATPSAYPSGASPTQSAPSGGYQTFTTQTGTATSVQQSSISVRGQDGAARTYTIDDTTRVCAGREGLSGIRTGDTVWVIGSGQGNSPKALVLVDLTRPRWAGRGPGGSAPPSAPPSPGYTSPPPGGSAPPPPVPSESESPETLPPTE